MDGVLLEGDALPSVRQISSEQRINPITVSKAFQILVDEELVEKKTGAWNVCLIRSEGKNYPLKKKGNFLNRNGHRLLNVLRGWAWRSMNSLAARRMDRNREFWG